MNVGGSFQNQNKTSDTSRYKEYPFTVRVSQVKVNTMERNFEQRSELQIAKSLIVHVLSGSYNVSNLELRNERKAKQQWNSGASNDIVLNQVPVYHEKNVCVQRCKQILICDVLFVSTLLQTHYQQYFWKFDRDPYQRRKNQIFHLQAKPQVFAFFETLQL